MEDYEDNDIGFVSAKQVMKLFEIQYRLRNLKAVRVDSTVRVLSQAEFLVKREIRFPNSGTASMAFI